MRIPKKQLLFKKKTTQTFNHFFDAEFISIDIYLIKWLISILIKWKAWIYCIF